MSVTMSNCAAKGARAGRWPLAALGAAVALLSACASAPPDHFYTLNGAVDQAPMAAAATPAPSAAAPPAAAPPLYIELQPVGLPQQVNRSQLVVSTGDGRVELLEQERWAGPLAGELGQALSLELSGALGAIDVYRTPHSEALPVYRISTSVQRFESAPGSYALIDAVWSVRPPSGNALTCRSVIRETVGPGYDALVVGHRRAAAQIAAAMARAVRGLANGGQAGC